MTYLHAGAQEGIREGSITNRILNKLGPDKEAIIMPKNKRRERHR